MLFVEKMILTSRNNPLIKETAALKEKKGRKEQGFFLVEGVKMVSECKRSGLEIGRTFVSESYRGETDENAICVSDEVFAFLSDEKTPQGILCSVRIPKPSLCPPKESCLLLDGVSDPAIWVRSFVPPTRRDTARFISSACTDPYSPKSVRASMSGIFLREAVYGDAGSEVLSRRFRALPDRRGGYGRGKYFFLSGRPQNSLWRSATRPTDFRRKFSERRGIYAAHPHARTAQESLNAGIAAGIAMYLF